MGSNTLGTALDTFIAAGGTQNIARTLQQNKVLEQQQQQQNSIIDILGGLGGVTNQPIPVTGAEQPAITGGLTIPDALPEDLGGQPLAVSQAVSTPTPPTNIVDQAVSIAELQRREQDQKRKKSLQIADAAIKLSFLGEQGARTANLLLQNQETFIEPSTVSALSEIKSITNSAINTMILEDEQAAIEQIISAGNSGLLSTEAKAILNNNIDKTNPGESIKNLSAALNQGQFAEIERQEALDIRQIREQGAIDQARKETPETIIDFKVPSGFRLADNNDPSKGVEPIPGGPEDRQTPEQAAKTELLNSGIKSLSKAKEILFDENGNVNQGVILEMTSRFPKSDGRRLNVELKNAVEAKLRAESGAAVPDSEVARAAERFIPSLLDDEETVKAKISNLDEFLAGTIDIIDPTDNFRSQVRPSTSLPSGITEEDIQTTLRNNPGETRAGIMRKLGVQ